MEKKKDKQVCSFCIEIYQNKLAAQWLLRDMSFLLEFRG